jgi:hypothetical protein
MLDMQPIKTFSPVAYWTMYAGGIAVFVGLLLVAWTSDTAEVGFGMQMKLQLSAAAVLLGGGLWFYARKYKRDAEIEARTRESVRRNLGRS